ncbi:terminase [Amycolatopsis anabasis]|uniref:terminase n=1 Tax=Amycolatopsis anabasis TaxID=1840409 RepID=UPI00131D5048|nr:terminase [Amycolatopsis anabasis]
MPNRKPTLPNGTGGATGRRLWKSVVDEYELDEHELALLVEAVRTVDALSALDADVQRMGVLVESPQGRKANPALVEARQQRIALARLLAALRLPSGDEADGRPQRRVGVRGPHRLGSVS